jgi:hypothetical protein
MHGRVVAELVPSGTPIEVRLKKRLNRYEQLVAEGVIHPAVDNGDPFEGADLEPVMAPGEAVALLDWLRGEE